MRLRIPLSIAAMIAMSTAFAACGNSRNATTLQAAADTARVAPSDLLPLPEVPDSLFDPVDRADYVLLHYWEALDFRNRKASDQAYMDANFAQFAEQYQYASDEGMTHATVTLLQHAEGYPDVYRLLADLAHKHLYTKGSPTYSEKAMLPWLRELAQAANLDEAERRRYQYLLEGAEKNAPGKRAADFSFVDVRGRTLSLSSLPRRAYTLMVFYDPDCETCHEILQKVRTDKRLMKPVDAGQVRVLLVDVAEDRDAFLRDATTFPANWTIGFDVSQLADKETYIFESTPTIYLLDSELKVILKDASIDQLIEYAQSKSGF